MYHIVTWSRDGSREAPSIDTVQTLTELCTLVYEAGIGNKGIVVQELNYSECHGETVEVLLDIRSHER